MFSMTLAVPKALVVHGQLMVVLTRAIEFAGHCCNMGPLLKQKGMKALS